MPIPLLSFFTGGGFLDIGFEQAGFKTVWTNEVNEVFADMYEHGMTTLRRAGGRKARAAKIANRHSITDLSARKVKSEAFAGCRPPLWGAIGGPPCPDFSRGGLNGGHRGKHGRLTRIFVDFIIDLRPDFFVMENVAGLLTTKKHHRTLESLVRRLRDEGKYLVDCGLLNALELGVPQDRERLFVVGFSRALARKALGERSAELANGWFPWPKDERYQGAKKLPWPRVDPFGGNPQLPGDIPLELTVFPLLSKANDPERQPNGKEFFQPHSPKFWKRGEGDVWNKSFKRLHRYRFSPTAWYGNNEVHLHPWKPRRLSVREALRIQTVPDEYELPEDAPLSRKFKLICNGVPVRMARCLGGAVMQFLQSSKTKAR